MQIVRCSRLIDCVVNSMNQAAVSKKDQICANLLARGTNKTKDYGFIVSSLRNGSLRSQYIRSRHQRGTGYESLKSAIFKNKVLCCFVSVNTLKIFVLFR